MAYIYWKKSVVFPLMEISLAMPLIPFYPLNLSFYIFRPTLHTTFDNNFFFSVSTPISSFPESFPRTNIRYQHSFLSLDFLVSTIPFRIFLSRQNCILECKNFPSLNFIAIERGPGKYRRKTRGNDGLFSTTDPGWTRIISWNKKGSRQKRPRYSSSRIDL